MMALIIRRLNRFKKRSFFLITFLLILLSLLVYYLFIYDDFSYESYVCSNSVNTKQVLNNENVYDGDNDDDDTLG
jgi:cytochrome c biogenesis factor